jgi:2-aminoethylphosphonate-pyruvate transaminase
VESTLTTLIPKNDASVLVVANGAPPPPHPSPSCRRPTGFTPPPPLHLAGAYGRRMAAITQRAGRRTVLADYDERRSVPVGEVVATVAADPRITHVAVVHHETTAGVLNDVQRLGTELQRIGAQRAGGASAATTTSNKKPVLIVDSMSGMGAYPVDVKAAGIDAVVSSSNKCVQVSAGRPGGGAT